MKTWQFDGPQTQEFGEGRPVESVHAVLVSGRLDVVAHPGRTGVRVDVHDVQGRPLTVSLREGHLKLEHHKDSGGGPLLDMLKGFLSNSRNASVRATLTVPVGARVTVNTVGADVLLGGVDGDVTVNTVSGAISLSRLGGRVDVKTVSSAIDASGLRGELKSKSVSGRLTVDSSALRSAKLGTVSGAMLLDLVGGSGLVTATGVSGDLTVRIPRDAGYDVTAGSQSGHVVVDGQTLSGGSGSDKGGHRSEGDRAFAMKLRTVSGNVVVLRDGDGGAPSASPFAAAGYDDSVQDVLPPRAGGLWDEPADAREPAAGFSAGSSLGDSSSGGSTFGGGATGGVWVGEAAGSPTAPAGGPAQGAEAGDSGNTSGPGAQEADGTEASSGHDSGQRPGGGQR